MLTVTRWGVESFFLARSLRGWRELYYLAPIKAPRPVNHSALQSRGWGPWRAKPCPTPLSQKHTTFCFSKRPSDESDGQARREGHFMLHQHQEGQMNHPHHHHHPPLVCALTHLRQLCTNVLWKTTKANKNNKKNKNKWRPLVCSLLAQYTSYGSSAKFLGFISQEVCGICMQVLLFIYERKTMTAAIITQHTHFILQQLFFSFTIIYMNNPVLK